MKIFGFCLYLFKQVLSISVENIMFNCSTVQFPETLFEKKKEDPGKILINDASILEI